MNKKGLTLIELLGVIIVLGIIAAISFPAINGVISNSRKDTVVENAKTFVGAVESYVNQLYLSGEESELKPEENVGNKTIYKLTVEQLKKAGYLDAKFAGDGESYVKFTVEFDDEVDDLYEQITVTEVMYYDTKIKYTLVFQAEDSKTWEKVGRSNVSKGKDDFKTSSNPNNS